ncbi:MAG TPA: molybdenum ABC transporter ATP-binding protein [Methylophilaceae bacterium]|nr:molybdenum ABC transporter ATP-binding protein [Methylophilaceae bacterium]
MIEMDLQRTRGAFNLRAKCTLDEPVIGLFGPSGAGKSSLLGMIAGLIKPDSGRLVLDGRCLFDSNAGTNVPLHQRHIGVVFQDSRLFPHLTVHANLNYGFNLLAAEERRFGFKQIVDLLEIGHLLQQKPYQLSGGEKQRVALGRALLTSPKLLLLDEPLASLDTRLKNQILPFLLRVKEQIQIPMIYVSHSIDEVLYLTTQMAMLDKGEMLGVGSFHEVIKDQRVMALAQSLGIENVMHLHVLEHHNDYGYSLAGLAVDANNLSASQQQLFLPLINAPVGAAVSVSIAAANIALSRERLSGVTIQNQLSGAVIDMHQVDSRVLVSIDIGSTQAPLIAEITAKAVHEMKIEVGNQLYCLMKTQSIRPLITAS